MPTDTIPDILDITQLARALGCSRRSIERRLAVGTFPIRPLPAIHSRRRWAGADVRQFLAGAPAGRLRRVG
jgi:predicted DNA-binding transcriptional regulator AlpA